MVRDPLKINPATLLCWRMSIGYLEPLCLTLTLLRRTLLNDNGKFLTFQEFCDIPRRLFLKQEREMRNGERGTENLLNGESFCKFITIQQNFNDLLREILACYFTLPIPFLSITQKMTISFDIPGLRGKYMRYKVRSKSWI